MAIPVFSQLNIQTPAGTPPLAVNQTDLVTNLNADYLDGQHGSFYRDAGNLNAGTIPIARLAPTIVPLRYLIPETSVTPQYVYLGRWATAQNGHKLRMTIAAAEGYNASVAQNQITDLYFKTSNNSSSQTGSTGAFYADGMAFRAGPNSNAPSSFRVVQVDSATYDIYGYFSNYTGGGSFYEVTISTGTWTHSGTLATPSGNFIDITPNAILHAGNYNSYSPTLTGTGASGTWGISISGTAATATTANGLNAANNYQVNSIGVGIAASGTAGSIGLNQAGTRSWSITPSGGNLNFASGDALGAANFSVALQQGGNQVLHAGNYTNYAIRSSAGLSVDISSTNLDQFTTTGFWRGNAMTGAPDAGWWYVIVESHDLLGTSGWVKQTVTAYGAGNSYSAGTTFIRVRTGGSTWGGWIRELDSVNYNSFALPLAGGTLTGALAGTSASFSSTLAATGAITQNGNQVLHAGNYTNYAFNASVISINVTTTADGSNSNPFDDAHSETKVAGSGVYQLSYTGASAHMLSSYAGGSASVFQIGAHYDGLNFYARVRTDSATWQPWRKLIHDGNYTSYPPARWATGRTISITGDVTGTSGAFDGTANLSFATTIANSAVTYAKIQNVAVSSVLGNSSASVAQAPQALSMATLAGMLSGQTMNIAGSSTSCTGNAATATNVAWSGITSKPTTVAGFGITDLVSSSSGNPFGADSATTNGFYYTNANISLFGQTDGALFVAAYDSSWIGQIYQDYRTGQIALRGRQAGTWQSWRTVLDSSNFTTYAPTLTGGSASGTWGISVTGSAGSGSRLGMYDGTAYYTGTNTIAASGGRGVSLAPNTYTRQISFEFKNTTFTSMTSTYGGLITIAPWDGTTASTGDPNYQLLINAAAANSTNAPTLRVRAGIDTTWGSWATLIHDANFATAIPNSGVTAGTYNNVTVNAKGIVTGGSNVGYLTGNQTISLSGDLSGSGTTSISATIAANAVTNTKIANSAVTYAKIQNVGAASVLGNTSASVSQPPAEITFANLGPYINGVARAWVTFSENPSTGAITVNASFGISSVTRLSAGVYQVNFSSAFSDTHYAVSGTIGYESISAYTNGGYLALTRTATPKTTTSCEVCASYGGTNYNARHVHVVFHR